MSSTAFSFYVFEGCSSKTGLNRSTKLKSFCDGWQIYRVFLNDLSTLISCMIEDQTILSEKSYLPAISIGKQYDGLDMVTLVEGEG